MKHLFAAVAVALTLASCTTVESGHQGVEISWGGETNMNMVYPEGMHSGVHWLWDDLVEYNARQQTYTMTNTFLDVDGLNVPIEAILYFNIQPNSANHIHKEIGADYVETKVVPIFKAALKNVIPRYKALELNATKRDEADQELAAILTEELSEVYVQFQRVNITDVDIPDKISSMIIAKQEQDEKNLLAEKKKLEKENLAAALIAEKKGEYEAAQYEAKTKDIMSQPKMLELKRLEVWEEYAKNGQSPYGTNNVFGSQVGVFKGLSN